MNFLELRTAILGYINRPSSEFDAVVGREINSVLLQMQRQHEFKYAERLIKVVYPANALQVDLTAVCEGVPRNYLNVQILPTAASNSGSQLKIVSYNTLQQERFRFQRSFNNAVEFNPALSTDDYLAQLDRARFFIVADAIGLYPAPPANVDLLINLMIWLPLLVDDTDENFLTTFASDLIIDKAVDRLNYYMKEDGRTEVAMKYTAESWQALILWDSQIRLASDA